MQQSFHAPIPKLQRYMAPSICKETDAKRKTRVCRNDQAGSGEETPGLRDDKANDRDCCSLAS